MAEGTLNKTHNISILLKRKAIAEIFMMILNLVYTKIFQHFKGKRQPLLGYNEVTVVGTSLLFYAKVR